MRLLPVVVLLSLVACKKDKPPPPPAPSKCTMAFLRVTEPERCETACLAGDAAACDVAAESFRGGITTRRDPGRALALGVRGCDLGASESCMIVSSVRTGQYDGQWPDGGVYANDAERVNAWKRSKVAAERECTAGGFRACSRLAYALTRPLEGDPDVERARGLAARAVSLMEKACAAGDGLACAGIAVDLDLGGLDLPREPAKAREFFGKACAAGYADACGRAYAVNAGDDVRGPFVQRGCELGQGDLCFSWSLQLEGEARTRALQRGCELRDGLSCHTLAREKKGEESQRLLERACRVGYETACQG